MKNAGVHDDHARGLWTETARVPLDRMPARKVSVIVRRVVDVESSAATLDVAAFNSSI
jgi:FXSXX-COOH protein